MTCAFTGSAAVVSCAWPSERGTTPRVAPVVVSTNVTLPVGAATHPRRNELQQALGGQPDVEPATYSGPLTAGDWVVVCSDGLSNHVSADDLKQMLQAE